jgi:hypothetical protein
MTPVDNNTVLNERSVVDQQLSIDTKGNKNSISAARKARKINNGIDDLVTSPTTFWTVYVLFFQFQI